MFDTNELRVLVGIMAGKTLAQIGEELLLSHPSVSKTLRAAERKAGLALVEQRGRRLRLTPVGLRVAAAAQEVLLKVGEMDALLAGLKTGQSGALRVLASTSVCNYVLPPVIGQLLKDVPDVDVSIQGADATSDIWAAFDRGDAEVAIARTLPPPHLAASHLFDDELCLCVATTSELRNQPDLYWPDLSDQMLIGPLEADDLWRQFSLLGIRPRSRIRVSNTAMAKRLVEDGHAIALLYRTVALDEAAQGRVAMLRLPDAAITVSYWMATRPSPLVDRFVQLLRQHTARLRVR
jgi:DNA-binding transcriptional LysR family regulator